MTTNESHETQDGTTQFDQWEEEVNHASPTQGDGTMLDRPEQIQMFALLQAAYRLSLEIRTGLKFRQSTLAAVQRAGITTKKTKKGALVDLIAVIQKANPNYVVSSTIAEALSK